VELLLDHGADIRLVDGKFRTNAVGWALERGIARLPNSSRAEAVKSTSRKRPSSGASIGCWSCARRGRLNRWRQRLGHGLTWGAAWGQLTAVELLLNRGADPSRLTSDNRTAGMVADQNGHAP
jgi:hypothetical protein